MSEEPPVVGDEVESRKWIRNPNGEIRRIGCLLVGVVIVCLFLIGQIDLLIELPFHLLAGWYLFLGRWSESGQIVWPDVVLAGLFLAFLTFGIHKTARWLVESQNRGATKIAAAGSAAEAAEASAGQDDGAQAPVLKWRWSLTLKLTAAVLVMFLAGTAMLGMAHQTLWLASSRGRIFDNSSHEFHGRLRTKGRLKFVGQAFSSLHDEASSQGESANAAADSMHRQQSWVTQLLPWLGPEAMRLDKPLQRDVAWDAPANHRIMQTAIPELQGRFSGRKTTDEGFAACHFAGNVHVFGSGRVLPFREFRDGTANTLLVGETRFRHKAWGDPQNLRDPTLGINQSPNGFGSHCSGIAHFLMADGSVKNLRNGIDPGVLRALSTPAGGEVLPSDY